MRPGALGKLREKKHTTNGDGEKRAGRLKGGKLPRADSTTQAKRPRVRTPTPLTLPSRIPSSRPPRSAVQVARSTPRSYVLHACTDIPTFQSGASAFMQG